MCGGGECESARRRFKNPLYGGARMRGDHSPSAELERICGTPRVQNARKIVGEGSGDPPLGNDPGLARNCGIHDFEEVHTNPVCHGEFRDRFGLPDQDCDIHQFEEARRGGDAAVSFGARVHANGREGRETWDRHGWARDPLRKPV